MISLILAASMWVEVKHPPTKEKVCVVGDNWIESKKLSCVFTNISLKEHPMVILPTRSGAKPDEYMYYQCTYKYKCEVNP